MDNKPDPENHQEPTTPPHVSSKPPIFYLYEFLQRQPILMGTLAGALLGLIAARQLGWPVNYAVIGGAVVGTVAAAILVRVRTS
jgi:hypothetical protein